MGSFGHLKPKGSSVLSFHSPNHIASVLIVFISRPESSLKLFNTLNKLVTESRSRTNVVAVFRMESAFLSTLFFVFLDVS